MGRSTKGRVNITGVNTNNIKDITDLSNYFVTSDGRDLISVLSEAMNEAKEMQCDIEIDNL